MVFLKGGWLLSTTDFLRLQVLPYGLLLTVVMEGAEGVPGNLFRLPLQLLSALFVEKRVMVSIQTTVPLLQVW